MFLTGRFSRVSMTVTVLLVSAVTYTQRPSGEIPTPSGSMPVGMVATTRPVDTSSAEAPAASSLEQYSRLPSGATAMRSGSDPHGYFALIFPVAASTAAMNCHRRPAALCPYVESVTATNTVRASGLAARPRGRATPGGPIRRRPTMRSDAASISAMSPPNSLLTKARGPGAAPGIGAVTPPAAPRTASAIDTVRHARLTRLPSAIGATDRRPARMGLPPSTPAGLRHVPKLVQDAGGVPPRRQNIRELADHLRQGGFVAAGLREAARHQRVTKLVVPRAERHADPLIPLEQRPAALEVAEEGERIAPRMDERVPHDLDGEPAGPGRPVERMAPPGEGALGELRAAGRRKRRLPRAHAGAPTRLLGGRPEEGGKEGTGLGDGIRESRHLDGQPAALVLRVELELPGRRQQQEHEIGADPGDRALGLRKPLPPRDRQVAHDPAAPVALLEGRPQLIAPDAIERGVLLGEEPGPRRRAADDPDSLGRVFVDEEREAPDEPVGDGIEVHRIARFDVEGVAGAVLIAQPVVGSPDVEEEDGVLRGEPRQRQGGAGVEGAQQHIGVASHQGLRLLRGLPRGPRRGLHQLETPPHQPGGVAHLLRPLASAQEPRVPGDPQGPRVVGGAAREAPGLRDVPDADDGRGGAGGGRAAERGRHEGAERHQDDPPPQDRAHGSAT